MILYDSLQSPTEDAEFREEARDLEARLNKVLEVVGYVINGLDKSPYICPEWTFFGNMKADYANHLRGMLMKAVAYRRPKSDRVPAYMQDVSKLLQLIAEAK